MSSLAKYVYNWVMIQIQQFISSQIREDQKICYSIILTLILVPVLICLSFHTLILSLPWLADSSCLSLCHTVI